MGLRLKKKTKHLNFVMGKETEKIVCHNCLDTVAFKTAFRVERNNFGIPHFVWICKKCKK
jgi:RNase P subunit RPR2